MSLRVMSFNIRYGTAKDGVHHWSCRRRRVVEAIADFGPDILGLQEGLAFQLDFLRDRLDEFRMVGRGRDDGERQGEFAAILMRADRFDIAECETFWLSTTPHVPGSRSWDGSLPRVVTWCRLNDRKTGNRPLWVFNTHLDHRGVIARRNSAVMLRRRLDELEADARVIVTGDFNATEDDAEYQTLLGANSRTELPLGDAYRFVHRNRADNEATQHGYAPPETGSRIDWILHSQSLVPVAADIVRREFASGYPSDHFPVTAVFEERG